MMESIMKNYLHPTWFQTDINKLCSLIHLNETDAEYHRLKKEMQKSFLKKLFSIDKVQNPSLYQQFIIKVAERSLFGKTIIKELFHCTAVRNVEPIIEENFDWRLCTRTKYGQGISFSTDASYANLQSNLYNGRSRAMIVADVIIGNRVVGDNNTVIPDEKYDTTTNLNETVFVKYCDNEFYPKFVIFYETYPVLSDNCGNRFIVHS